jgi:hypothetical protein
MVADMAADTAAVVAADLADIDSHPVAVLAARWYSFLRDDRTTAGRYRRCLYHTTLYAKIG